MKILYLAMESANWVMNLCNEFAKKGHDVTCVVQMSDDYDRENQPESHDSLTIHRLDFDDFLDANKFQTKCLTKLDKSYDLVFGSHCPVAPMVEALGNHYKIPWGIMLLDIPTDLMQKQEWRLRQWMVWFTVLQRANVIVTNTDIAGEEYERYTNTPVTGVVTYATKFLPEYKMSAVESDSVVSICRLTDIKNCKLIPQALPGTGIEGYTAIGRDSGELGLIQHLSQQNNIKFEHKVEITEKDKYEIIKHSTALIYPQNSEYIGGLSPFEGMYVGIPAVVPNLRVLKDLYGEHAYYFKNNDVESLRKTLKELRDNPPTKEKLQAASDYAEQQASYETMAKGLLEIFEEMLNNG